MTQNNTMSNEPPAALLRCANCGTALGNHSSISFACPTASVGYFTAPVANESRGSVPDDLAGRVHDEIMRLDGGVRRWEHMGESQRAAWRNGLSILTPTPPAVASEEPTAEQLKVIDEVIRLLESPHVVPTPTGGINYTPERYFGLLHDFKRVRTELAAAQQRQGGAK